MTDLKEWSPWPATHKTTVNIHEVLWNHVSDDASHEKMTVSEVINRILNKHYKERQDKVEASMLAADPQYAAMVKAIDAIEINEQTIGDK